MSRSSLRRTVLLLAALLPIWLAACEGAPPFEIALTPVTAVPTLNTADPAAVCAAVDAAWGADWPRAIQLLELLAAQGADCAGQPGRDRLYAAHTNYGRSLEEAGQAAEAAAQYEAALALRPEGSEAAEALRGLGVYTPAPLPTCSPAEVAAALDSLPPYEPSDMAGFVAVEGDYFVLGDAVYAVQGVNYYPLRHPWRRFLSEADLEEVRFELGLLREAGFNTLRLFLWHGALFTCPGSGAVPVAEAFARLDGVIRAAAERGFRLIMTLNDLPDLTAHPLYSSPPHNSAQVAFLVGRYREEAAILAWDLRNEGDLDYTAEGGFDRHAVLSWLAQTAALVREHDGRHLITAGWHHDAEATIPYVDFVSFHHWDDALRLRMRIALLRSQTDKPILLEEFGYSTYHFDPYEQSRLLREAIQAAQFEGIAGWLIWTAFDFPPEATCIPPACPDPDSAEHHFGLWTVDYAPKPALNMIRALIRLSAGPSGAGEGR